MCGIAGILVKDELRTGTLGSALADLLTELAERGSDSTGVAIYGREDALPTIIKDIGPAPEVCAKNGISSRAGYMGIGHTRMATESAVTALHSHPFTPDGSLCLVHNGSFSNHATVRRKLQHQGVAFDTDNDSEVAARYLGWRGREGDGFEVALRRLSSVMDGFFTLLVAQPGHLALVRDAYGCKPAVVAETEQYVAVASEYRALATLPDIESARVFEPGPGEVCTWSC